MSNTRYHSGDLVVLLRPDSGEESSKGSKVVSNDLVIAVCRREAGHEANESTVSGSPGDNRQSTLP